MMLQYCSSPVMMRAVKLPATRMLESNQRDVMTWGEIYVELGMTPGLQWEIAENETGIRVKANGFREEIVPLGYWLCIPSGGIRPFGCSPEIFDLLFRRLG